MESALAKHKPDKQDFHIDLAVPEWRDIVGITATTKRSPIVAVHKMMEQAMGHKIATRLKGTFNTPIDKLPKCVLGPFENLLSALWQDSIVPIWQDIGKLDCGADAVFHFFGSSLAGLVGAANDVDGCSQAGGGAGLSH